MPDNATMIERAESAEEFPLVAFTTDLVTKLTGLSVSQLHRWDRTGFFTPSLADPDRGRRFSRIYSLHDVIGLRLIAYLRAAGASLVELNRVRSAFLPDEQGRWPVAAVHVVGSRVYLSRAEAMAAATTLGPEVGPVTFSFDAVIAEIDDAMRRLRQREPDQIGQVTRNRWIMGGAPIIAGTRIPTATIAWFAAHGYAVARILEEFPRLTADDVRAAVDFERNQAVATPDLVLANG
jgi:uncharacterized protein (DUF433 family)